MATNSLQAVFVVIRPAPYDLHTEGVRAADLFFAELFRLFDEYPELNLALSISGFILDNLRARERLAFLRRLAELSREGRIELPREPHYPLSLQLSTEKSILEAFGFQQRFWREFDAKLTEAVFDAGNPRSQPIPITANVNVGLTAIAISEREDFSTAIIQLKNLARTPGNKFLLGKNLGEFKQRSNSTPVEPNYLALRASLLRDIVDRVPEIVETRSTRAREENRRAERVGAEHRLELAHSFALQATSTVLDDPLNPRAQRSAFEFIMRGQVEIEGYLHPDVDPTVGWLKHHSIQASDRDGSWINTQLTDVFLSTDGTLLEYDYKPQKVALFGAFPGRSFVVTTSVPPDRRVSSPGKIIRSALDLLSIRFEEELWFTGGKAVRVVRELSFRAGTGAHLLNATTGFNCEYWVEGEVPDGLEISIGVDLTLPSPSLSSGIAKPLMCVGGVSEKRFELEDPQIVQGKEINGGLFGLRIVDSLDDLILDFRTSKQLESVKFEPIVVQGTAQAIAISFILSGKRIIGDEKSNTLFFSVM